MARSLSSLFHKARLPSASELMQQVYPAFIHRQARIQLSRRAPYLLDIRKVVCLQALKSPVLVKNPKSSERSISWSDQLKAMSRLCGRGRSTRSGTVCSGTPFIEVHTHNAHLHSQLRFTEFQRCHGEERQAYHRGGTFCCLILLAPR